MQHGGNSYNTRHNTISNFDNPKMDIEIDYSTIKSDKQLNASKYLHDVIFFVVVAIFMNNEIDFVHRIRSAISKWMS